MELVESQRHVERLVGIEPRQRRRLVAVERIGRRPGSLGWGIAATTAATTAAAAGCSELAFTIHVARVTRQGRASGSAWGLDGSEEQRAAAGSEATEYEVEVEVEPMSMLSVSLVDLLLLLLPASHHTITR